MNKLKLPESYHCSIAAKNVLTGGGFDILPLGHLNIQRITSFRRKMKSLFKELSRICKPHVNENYEGYYLNYISKKENNKKLSNWYLILNELRGDLDYFSDRWCYARYISIQRLYTLFLEDYNDYHYYIGYRYNKITRKWFHPVKYLGKNSGYLKISSNLGSDFKSWREKLTAADCILNR